MVRTRNLRRMDPSRRLSSRTPHAISLSCFLVSRRELGASTEADCRSSCAGVGGIGTGPAGPTIDRRHCFSSACPTPPLPLPLDGVLLPALSALSSPSSGRVCGWGPSASLVVRESWRMVAQGRLGSSLHTPSSPSSAFSCCCSCCGCCFFPGVRWLPKSLSAVWSLAWPFLGSTARLDPASSLTS